MEAGFQHSFPSILSSVPDAVPKIMLFTLIHTQTHRWEREGKGKRGEEGRKGMEERVGEGERECKQAQFS